MKQIYLKPTVKITPIQLERVIASSTIEMSSEKAKSGAGMDSKNWDEFDELDEDLW